MPALALTRTADPGVENTAPRGELTLKKSGGRLLGSARLLGTPSQLISRRPEGKLPATLGLSPPKLARNASTTGDTPAASAPAPWNTTGAAPTGAVVSPRGARPRRPTTTRSLDTIRTMVLPRVNPL